MRVLREGLVGLGLPGGSEELERLGAYLALLEEVAIPRGFLGPREGDRLISRHLLESAALGALIGPPTGSLVDVGSGAGLPGLVLACLGWRVTLIESLERRASFLQEAIDATGVDARVVVARAEDAARTDLRESADVVVARALAAPRVALELCLPFARLGGRVVLPTTPDAAGDDAGTSAVAAELGGGSVRWEPLGRPAEDEPARALVVEKLAATPDRFPRRAGVPKRRPLG